jgi:hypothetical protein
MFPEPVMTAEKANGSSIQGRYSGESGFDFPTGPINPFQLFTIGMTGLQSDGIPPWSYYPQWRDGYLRLLSKREPIMAGCLYSVVSRIKSLPWNIKGGRNVKAYYQDLFGMADGGAGYGQFVSKIVTDLLTQDNGAFVELVGAGKPDRPLVGRVTELYHLDSAQCWRTFDPEFPVIYTNPLDNSYHRLHKTRVIMLSSQPQPDERARNVGLCAVSRTLKIMQIMRHIQQYKEEKISGKFKRGFIYGNGLTDKQFKQATAVADANAENNNFMVYNEIPVLLSMMQDMKLNVLDLASLPDGFNFKEEMDIYVYSLALGFGVDAREFWPATASGATKADASVQHMKAQGKGIADITKMLETAFNWQLMPSNGSAEIEYDNKDDEQDKAKADIDTVRITNVQLMQQNGNISAQEGRALLIAQGVIDPKQLVVSEDNQLADDSAPMADQTTLDAQVQQTTQPTDSFDTTQGAAALDSKVLRQTMDSSGGSYGTPGKFDPGKHPRSTNGKFGSGGGSAKPAVPTTPAQGAAPQLSPIAQQIKNFLDDIGMKGKFENGVLTVPGQSRNKSSALRKYLRAHGFPNAKVVGKKTADGMTYTIQESPKKAKKSIDVSAKATDRLLAHVDDYKSKLEGLAKDFVSQVVESPDDFDNAVDDLYDEFADLLPGELTDAFGVGLAGEQPTKDGVDRLKKVGQTSHDYFKDSFLTALGAVSLTGLATDEIQAALDPFVSRLGMYAGSYWESIWQGNRDATPASTRVRRVLNGSNHCATCPDKEGDYESYDAMVAEAGMPGDGSDDCLSNCRCTLETEDEDGGFSPLVGEPTVFTEPLFEVLR